MCGCLVNIVRCKLPVKDTRTFSNTAPRFRLDDVRYEQISDETLESVSEYLEELVALDTAPQDCDVLYSVSIEGAQSS